MFGPAAVLDDYGSATEASGLQNFLQWIPNPYVFERENSDRNAPIQRNRYQIVSLAETLSWSIPDANRGMSTNSPQPCRTIDHLETTDDDCRPGAATWRAMAVWADVDDDIRALAPSSPSRLLVASASPTCS